MWVFWGQDFVFRTAINMSYWEITAKIVTPNSFLSLSLKTLVNNKIFKNIFIKEKLDKKLNIFIQDCFKIKVFARTLTTHGFKCRIISVKLVFGVKMLPLNF